MKLKDHVAIVTGAAMGIGKSIAEVMAEEGAEIICQQCLDYYQKNRVFPDYEGVDDEQDYRY